MTPVRCCRLTAFAYRAGSVVWVHIRNRSHHQDPKKGPQIAQGNIGNRFKLFEICFKWRFV